MELVFQFSTDSPENSCPHEDNSSLSCKEIPDHFFPILVFHDPRSTYDWKSMGDLSRGFVNETSLSVERATRYQ